VSLELKDKKRGIGFSFAWNGIMDAVRSERNFRIHLAFGLLAIFTGFLLRISRVEWALIVLVIGMVLVTELFNTAIEKVIDYLKPDIHPSAKFVKDVAAGTVLISAFAAVVIGCLIFIPRLGSIL